MSNIIKLPRFWKDELMEILLSQGFDAVIKQIEEYFKQSDFFIDNGTAKPL